MTPATLVGAAIALFSAVIGAFLQGIVSRRSEYIKAGRQARYDAYADYFKGVAPISHAAEDKEIIVANALIADARGRIALYGSADVIVAMAKAFGHCRDAGRRALDRPDGREAGAVRVALWRETRLQ